MVDDRYSSVSFIYKYEINSVFLSKSTLRGREGGERERERRGTINKKNNNKNPRK